MTIIYCAVADKTLNSVKNTSLLNGIRYLDATNWHIENNSFSISADILSVKMAPTSNSLPGNKNILKILADKLIQVAGRFGKRLPGNQAINPLLDYANIFCLDLPHDYFQSLNNRIASGMLMLDSSKVIIVGVFRFSIYENGSGSNKKVLEILLNKSADKQLCENFQVLAQEIATTMKKHLHEESVDFTIDGKISESQAPAYSIRDFQSQTFMPPPPAAPLPATVSGSINERNRLLEPPPELAVSKNDQGCSCVLL